METMGGIVTEKEVLEGKQERREEEAGRSEEKAPLSCACLPLPTTSNPFFPPFSYPLLFPLTYITSRWPGIR